ncbi:androgen-dependent TFPI-regulating protein, putative [Babesia ovata]|uniref:Androgen-dependent TFPI-regulating protein, putative n=1 Tax=Babesia ovata TaxID=189622 RepID=A0A2H6KAF2_9APIC|nr:androgen-dependent TFPI-regulating protein, putative [Babesia ovata]GBE59968.1 androgen-dependent TFPI-regulating protein, putative [Babesia ovata]
MSSLHLVMASQLSIIGLFQLGNNKAAVLEECAEGIVDAWLGDEGNFVFLPLAVCLVTSLIELTQIVIQSHENGEKNLGAFHCLFRGLLFLSWRIMLFRPLKALRSPRVPADVLLFELLREFLEALLQGLQHFFGGVGERVGVECLERSLEGFARRGDGVVEVLVVEQFVEDGIQGGVECLDLGSLVGDVGLRL